MNYFINLIWENMTGKNLGFVVLLMQKHEVIMISKLCFHVLNLLRINFYFLDVYF